LSLELEKRGFKCWYEKIRYVGPIKYDMKNCKQVRQPSAEPYSSGDEGWGETVLFFHPIPFG
jgi:hypothetical protein